MALQLSRILPGRRPGRRYEDPKLESLAAVVDLALVREVHIVLIAGDLFDHARVKQELVDQTLLELARMNQPVVIIPGNHDPIGHGSLYERVDLRKAGPHVHFIGEPAGKRLRFAALALNIWARGIETHDPQHRPLEGYQPGDPAEWQVVMTHGHYLSSAQDCHLSSRIPREEIAGLSCHYLALGHWHRFTDVSAGKVSAFYAGAPSDETGALASINIVHLDPEDGVHVERQTLTS